MKLTTALILFLMLPLRAFGQNDPNALRDNIMHTNSQSNAFVYDLSSAVAKYYLYDQTLYQVEGFYGWDTAHELFIDALGSSESAGGMDVNVAHRLNATTLFYADAQYKGAKNMDVSLNSVADYQRLYPYIMRDSVGGDLNSEQYRFTLGYVQSVGNFILGAKFRYIAAHNYRLVDPRPRNITSELSAGVTAAYQLGNYTLGADYTYARYTQQSNVSIYNPMGGAIQYHYLGLGIHSERFSSLSSAALMRGGEHNISLNVMPRSGYGFFVDASYKKEDYEKIITDHHNLPLNSLDNNTYYANVAYRVAVGKYDLSAKAEIEQHKRVGIEQAFGSAADSYPPISKVEAFEMLCNRASFSVLAQRNVSNKVRLGLLVGAELFNASISRYDSSIEWSDLSPKAEVYLDYSGEKMWGTFRLATQYTNAQNGGATHNLASEVVDDFGALLTQLWSNSAAFDLYFKLNSRIALKLGTQCTLAQYKGYNNTYLFQHTIGIVF